MPPAGGGGQQAPSNSRSKTPLLLGLLLTLLLVAAGAFFFVRDAQAGEVFLVPAASAGPDPFSATPFAEPPDPAIAQPASASSAPTPANPNAAPVQATSGAQPGLYGGTMNSKACNPDQMVAFLSANPDKAQAWVEALTADPKVSLRDGRPLTTATIPEYVDGLTSFVLLTDTRVTNHGFKNGRPTVLQSVLQKGSAVMVDEYGTPRVKCYCGNPLLPPVPSRQRVTYQGPRWPDFDENRITVVSPPPQPVQEFTACDPRDPSDCFNVPPGGDPYETDEPSGSGFTLIPGSGFEPSEPAAGDPVPPQSMVSENPPQAFPPPDQEVDPPAPLRRYECSEPAGQEMEISITNDMRETATIVWIDEECDRHITMRVAPGETSLLTTYAGHNHVALIEGVEHDWFRAGSSGSSWVIQ